MNDHETFEQHFWEAISIQDETARRQFIHQVSADSTDMHARLQSLVDNHFRASGFLERLDADGAAESTLETTVQDLAGSRVRQYQLHHKIGEGGMGVVFAAEQIEPLRRRVAIKLIKPGLDSRQMVARFNIERQTLALMDHPNIAKILEAGTTEAGLPFFAMELVEGQRITHFCDAHELSIRDRLNLFLAVIDAVQHAHQKGIIHRDLKPSNILVTFCDGIPLPKVIDFGIAKAVGPLFTDQSFSTQFGQLVGTFHYMSPEQVDRSQSHIDTRSDVYSLGIVLYELLTGQTPFDEGAFQAILLEEVFEIIRHQEPLKPSRKLSTSETLVAISTKRGLDPAKLISTVRGELDWIVLKSLEKEQARRYDSAASFRADILRYLNDEAVEASPPSRSYRFRKAIRRNRSLVAATLLFLGVLVFGLVGTTWQARVASGERDLAREATKRAIAAERLSAAQLARANEEALVAAAVNSFLEDDLLGMADTGKQVDAMLTPDPDIKLRTLLERADANLEQRFAGQPRVRAEIQETLGVVFMAIGEYFKAVDLLEQSAEYFEQTLGIEHSRTARAWSHLGLAYHCAGRLHDAVNIQLKEIAINESILGVDHHDTLLSRSRLASSYWSLAQFSDAEAIFEPLLQKMRATLGADHYDTVVLMNNLASCYQISGNPTKRAMAIPLQEQALKLHRIIKGDRHPESIRMTMTLANVYGQNDQIKKSHALSEEVLSLAQDVIGAEHPFTLSAMASVIAAYDSTNRQREAIELEKQALATARKVMPEHPDIIDWITRVSQRYTRVHDHERALPLNLEALELSRSIRGSTHRRTLQLLESVASNLGGLRRYTEQTVVLEQLQALRDQALESNRSALSRRSPALAEAYANGGRYLKSIEVYTQLLNELAEMGQNTGMMTGCKLVACYSEAGLDDRAIQLAKEILEQVKREPAVDGPDTWIPMTALALAYQRAGKSSEAVKIFRELYDDVERSDANPRWHLALLVLADAYRLDRQNERAIELFDRFLSLETDSIGSARGRARLSLAKTHLALHQREQAVEIYQQFVENSMPILDRLAIPPSTEVRVTSRGDTHFHHVPPRPRNAKAVMRPLSILADLSAQLGRLDSARDQLTTLAKYQLQLVGVSDRDYVSTLARLGVVRKAVGSGTSEEVFPVSSESTAPEDSYYRALASMNMGDMAGFRNELSALEQSYAIDPTPEILYWIVNASVLHPAAARSNLLELREQLLSASQSERSRLVAAAALVRSGNLERAVEELEALLQAWLELDPKPQDCPLVLIRQWLALAYSGVGSHERALECARAANAWFDADRSEFPWELFLTCRILSDEFDVGP